MVSASATKHTWFHTSKAFHAKQQQNNEKRRKWKNSCVFRTIMLHRNGFLHERSPCMIQGVVLAIWEEQKKKKLKKCYRFFLIIILQGCPRERYLWKKTNDSVSFVCKINPNYHMQQTNNNFKNNNNRRTKLKCFLHKRVFSVRLVRVCVCAQLNKVVLLWLTSNALSVTTTCVRVSSSVQAESASRDIMEGLSYNSDQWATGDHTAWRRDLSHRLP